MKILHIIHQYPPDHVGGTEHYTQGLATAQAAAGHSVAVFYPRNGYSGLTYEERNGVDVYAAGVSDRSRLGVFAATFGAKEVASIFEQVVSEFKPDVLHVQHLMGLPMSLIDHAKRIGLRCVFTLHDYWPLCGNAQLLTNYDHTVCDGPRLWLNCARCSAARLQQPALLLGAPAVAALFGWRARSMRRVLRQFDAILSPSHLVAQMAIRAGADPSRVHHMPLGIDTSGAQPRARRSDGKLRVAYIGSLGWQKGVHILVEAFNQVPEPATLVVYGDPHVFPEYSRELRALAQSPRIRFAGKLARADLWSTLADVDLIAVPSIWYENKPTTILEAFAAGVPAMVSDLGTFPELVEEGRSGWLVKVRDVDAWAKALTDLATGIRPRIDVIKASASNLVTDHMPKVLSIYRGDNQLRRVPRGERLR